MKAFLPLLMGVALFTSAGCSVNVGMKKTEQLEEVVLSQNEGRDKILLLAIDGMISFEPTGSFLGKEPSMVASVREQLDRARQDDRVKGVILRINSPGGTLGATQMIYDELTQFRKETGAYMLGLFLEVAASGALYISMASDQIMAYPSAVTGSMGVIFISPSFEELGKKVGIQYRVVKSGAKKDMATPFRSWPPDEQKMLETLAQGYNEQFKNVVFNTRKAHGMSLQDFEMLTDGRIISAEQAHKTRLVDEIGNLSTAIAHIEKNNNRGRMKVVTYTRYPDEVKNPYSRGLTVSAGVHNLDLGSVIGHGSQGMLESVLQATSSAQVLSKGFYYLW